jgi:hypothetical protein
MSEIPRAIPKARCEAQAVIGSRKLNACPVIKPIPDKIKMNINMPATSPEARVKYHGHEVPSFVKTVSMTEEPLPSKTTFAFVPPLFSVARANANDENNAMTIRLKMNIMPNFEIFFFIL